MDLGAGSRLGPYEIIAALGAGGMGEVYRACDTRLDRDVAIKILPSNLCGSPELKSRFEREARTLSSVSHPHICHLYDVGSQAGVEFLVMELLEGDTLAQRLQRGPLPLPEVLKIGIGISDALAYAHRLGVTHRDLKPSNIMLTKSGAKLMDFGLAKPAILESVVTRSNLQFGSMATATFPGSPNPISSAGMMIGTINYMSPEQVEGKEADARSDIFALGAVFYEMATGQRAFEGKSHLSVASAILHQEPSRPSTIRTQCSEHLDYLIRTCLIKDPDERFQSAHDVKVELSWLLQAGNEAAVQPPLMEGWLRRHKIAALLAGVTILACFALLLFRLANRSTEPTSGVTRFTIPLPTSQELAVDTTQALALSPDGKRLAYVGAESGVSHLYVRRLDEFEPVAIPDSEGATFPFFSPSGDWIAFFSQGKLKKAPVNGGVPLVICALPTFFGGTWTPQDIIVVAVPGFGLATVPSAGGDLQKVPVSTKDEIYPQGPTWIGRGNWIAFTDYFAAKRSVMAVKLDTGELRLLLSNAQGASYAAGHLIYYASGALWEVPFDDDNLKVLGDATEIESGVSEQNYVAQSSASSTGVLAYAPGPAGNFSRNLYVVDRKGIERKLDVPAQDYVDPAISPDGKRIAITIRRVNEQQLEVLERDRSALTNLVANEAVNAAPEWKSDGKTLFFDSVGSSSKRGIYRVAADGTGAPQLLKETSSSSHITAIAGDYAALTVNDPVTSTDLWLLSLRDPYELRPFKRTSAAERQGALSPDGRWMAYASNESGRSEVYVEPVPGPGGRWQISVEGGEQPRWLRNGREIVYRNGTKMMSVPVETRPAFRSGKAIELFDRRFDRGGAVNGYDVTADGLTFVMTRSEHASPTEIRVVIGSLAKK
ncbi:MAG: hypothetical protein NVSMB58_20630 [Terriglobales bacterium]